MGILQELAKRAALKTKTMAQEIPLATEQVTHLPVPRQASPLAEVSKAQVLKEIPAYRPAPEGLESPQRRKILKQAAATALRASVPDQIADPLMKMATSPLEEGMARALKEANLTVSPKSLSKTLTDFLYQGGIGDELYDIGAGVSYKDILKGYLMKLYPSEQIPHLDTALKKLKSLESDDFDPSYDLYDGNLVRLLKGESPSSYYDQEIIPEIHKGIQSKGFTAEERQALEHLQENMPRATEDLDNLIDGEDVPYHLSPKELQEWIFSHGLD